MLLDKVCERHRPSGTRSKSVDLIVRNLRGRGRMRPVRDGVRECCGRSVRSRSFAYSYQPDERAQGSGPKPCHLSTRLGDE